MWDELIKERLIFEGKSDEQCNLRSDLTKNEKLNEERKKEIEVNVQ